MNFGEMFTKKVIASISTLAVLVSLVCGIWALEGHYQTKAEAKEKFEAVEIQVAGALQNQEIRSNYKFYQFLYDKLTQDLQNIKRLLRRDPNDQELKEDYQEVKKEIKELKKKLDKLLEKIS